MPHYCAAPPDYLRLLPPPSPPPPFFFFCHFIPISCERAKINMLVFVLGVVMNATMTRSGGNILCLLGMFSLIIEYLPPPDLGLFQFLRCAFCLTICVAPAVPAYRVFFACSVVWAPLWLLLLLLLQKAGLRTP